MNFTVREALDCARRLFARELIADARPAQQPRPCAVAAPTFRSPSRWER